MGESRQADDHNPGAAHPGVRNEVNSPVYGPVVQARDIASLHVHQAVSSLPVPCQLPPRPAQFVNRHAEVKLLDRLIACSSAMGAPPVVLVTGGHGVGKSATSKHWAHVNSGRFPDGQLYSDFAELRHRGGVGVGDVLGGFLRALGLGDEVIPSELAERTALFRSKLAGKRLLVLLDDVDQAAQVKPLIPGSPDCAVLVTSRAPLSELIGDGAGVVRLAPLDASSSEALLSGMIGEPRVEAEPDAVAELARICGGLPVALRICGAQLAGPREDKPVSWLAKRLADDASRLERLSYGPGHSLQAVFDEAYRALLEAQASLYWRLGLHPGPSFAASAVGAVLGAPTERAEELLDDLCAAHMVEDGVDRFRFHDLLRAHARRTAEQRAAGEQEVVVRWFIAFYVAAVQRMDHVITPDRLRMSSAPEAGEPELVSPAAGLAWFEAERPNLVAAVRAAYEREWYRETWQLAEAMWIAYGNHKHFEEAHEVYTLGVEAAQCDGHLEAEARMRQQLARAHMDLKQYAEAERELELAERLAGRSANRMLQASVIEFIGLLHLNRREFGLAVESLQRARDAFGAIAYMRGVVLQEYLLGRAFTGMGKPQDAVRHLLRARELVDRDGDGLTYGRVLTRLGEAQLAAGERAAAGVSLRQAAAVMSEHDAPHYVAMAFSGLAEMCRQEGDRPGESEHLTAALDIFTVLSDPRAEGIRTRLARLAG